MDIACHAHDTSCESMGWLSNFLFCFLNLLGESSHWQPRKAVEFSWQGPQKANSALCLWLVTRANLLGIRITHQHRSLKQEEAARKYCMVLHETILLLLASVAAGVTAFSHRWQHNQWHKDTKITFPKGGGKKDEKSNKVIISTRTWKGQTSCPSCIIESHWKCWRSGWHLENNEHLTRKRHGEPAFEGCSCGYLRALSCQGIPSVSCRSFQGQLSRCGGKILAVASGCRNLDCEGATVIRSWNAWGIWWVNTIIYTTTLNITAD